MLFTFSERRFGNFANIKCDNWKKFQSERKLACSQTLYFLFKVRRARVNKNKNRGGFIDRQHKR